MEMAGTFIGLGLGQLRMVPGARGKEGFAGANFRLLAELGWWDAGNGVCAVGSGCVCALVCCR